VGSVAAVRPFGARCPSSSATRDGAPISAVVVVETGSVKL